MTKLSILIQTIANNAGISYGKAEKMLRWAAGWETAVNDPSESLDYQMLAMGKVSGVRAALEALGASAPTITRAIEEINKEAA